MSTSYPPSPPAPTRPLSTRTPAAHVNPAHLPALRHVAADLQSLTTPVKVVPADCLGPCEDCPADARLLDVHTAIARVVAYDPQGFRISILPCALHLPGAVRHFTRHGWPMVVEVPACEGRKWFERSDRETFYAVSDRDPLTGVAATRGIWDAWQVIDVVDGFGSSTILRRFGLLDGESFNDARLRAEWYAQAVAAQRAADAYEAARSVAETVEMPVVAVSEVAA